MLGLNPNVKPGVIALSDHIYIFVCGNNIVIHNTIEKTQKYIPGIDGTQGISTMQLSPDKRYLAVCERHDQPICVIYDLVTLKRKRFLTTSEAKATDYTDVAFATSDDDKLQQYLVTLTNRGTDGQFRLQIWLWDK